MLTFLAGTPAMSMLWLQARAEHARAEVERDRAERSRDRALVAFDVLMAERSVTRAAERLSIGQSAMSSTLARLRKLFGDPLLVRDGRAVLAVAQQPQRLAAVPLVRLPQVLH